VGQKLKFARFLSKIPEPLQLPALAAGSVGPDPHPCVDAAVPVAVSAAAATAGGSGGGWRVGGGVGGGAGTTVRLRRLVGGR
jgi:hypothetical protein